MALEESFLSCIWCLFLLLLNEVQTYSTGCTCMGKGIWGSCSHWKLWRHIANGNPDSSPPQPAGSTAKCYHNHTGLLEFGRILNKSNSKSHSSKNIHVDISNPIDGDIKKDLWEVLKSWAWAPSWMELVSWEKRLQRGDSGCSIMGRYS